MLDARRKRVTGSTQACACASVKLDGPNNTIRAVPEGAGGGGLSATPTLHTPLSPGGAFSLNTRSREPRLSLGCDLPSFSLERHLSRLSLRGSATVERFRQNVPLKRDAVTLELSANSPKSEALDKSLRMYCSDRT